MSEMGDDFREQRHGRQDVRRTWPICYRCGRKSAPSEPCFHCQHDEWIEWNKKKKVRP